MCDSGAPDISFLTLDTGLTFLFAETLAFGLAAFETSLCLSHSFWMTQFKTGDHDLGYTMMIDSSNAYIRRLQGLDGNHVGDVGSKLALSLGSLIGLV